MIQVVFDMFVTDIVYISPEGKVLMSFVSWKSDMCFSFVAMKATETLGIVSDKIYV